MDIVIDFQGVADLLNTPLDVLVFNFVLYVGWMPIVILLLWMSFHVWMTYIGGKFSAKREFTLLAIDVPVGNEQTPRAVEHLFTQLAGVHGTINLIDKYWSGKSQDWFSFEIVSIDGYTQFLIYTERKYYNFLEQIVYAQYPDAEITEVDDYTTEWPDRLPDENYDLWGSEFVLVENNYLPLRTYLDFEHQFSGEFIDPLAAMMELMGSLRKGEQCAFQIIITPIDPTWEKGAPDAISQAIGEKKKSKQNIVDKGVALLVSFLGGIADFFIPTEAGDNPQKEDDDRVNMQDLRPVQQKQMEAIQQKVSKIGFEVKVRWLYLAEHEVMDKTRVSALVGVMRQFGVQDTNSFKPDTNYTMTSTAYVRTASRLLRRKNVILSSFRSRSNFEGRQPMILNTEELATLWHFPVESSARAPLLQKVPSRKAEAPSSLPTEISAGADDADWREAVLDYTPPAIAGDEPAAKHEQPDQAEAQEANDGGATDEERSIFGATVSDNAHAHDDEPAASSAAESDSPRTGGAPPPNLPIG